MKSATAMAPTKTIRNLLATNPLGLLQSRFFDNPLAFFSPLAEENWPLTTWTPACDIYETEKEIVIKAELPDVKKENVYVSLENNVLMIRGERRFEDEARRENYHRIERNYGEFLRSFTLPAFIEPDKVHAEFKDGILNVILPKLEEARPKQIEVKVE
jgi:HSP20 family protein